MQTMKQAAAEFLAGKRVAVTGVSRNPKDHGSNVVYQRLRQRGYQVFAVNRFAHSVRPAAGREQGRRTPGPRDFPLCWRRSGRITIGS